MVSCFFLSKSCKNTHANRCNVHSGNSLTNTYVDQKTKDAGRDPFLLVIHLIYEKSSFMVRYFHLTSIFTFHVSLWCPLTSSPHSFTFSFLLMSSSCLYSSVTISHMLWSDSMSSLSSRRFFRDLRSSLWLQRNWLQRRSAVGECAVLLIYSSCLL